MTSHEDQSVLLRAIDGLRSEPNWRVENGQDSFVIPFATLFPVTIVFHGARHFDYGHYGVHLGQEDRLTFLGSSTQSIIASFIDCRAGSRSLHKRIQVQLSPDSGRVLCIPPGVAHAFEGLERVYTVNNYRLFLPDPEKWAAGETSWDMGSDVLNVPLDVSDKELPVFDANPHEAGEAFYRLVAEQQRVAIPNIQHQYPYTEDVKFTDGHRARLRSHKKLKSTDAIPEWESVHGIDGLGWARHLVLQSGENSGFIALIDCLPFYVVDHGTQEYSHDAFGIHLGQEDRLTFLGEQEKTVRVQLCDCREGSLTLHREVSLEFAPDPRRFLVIPQGVAHRFEGLENVYTLNRPRLFADDEKKYQPGNDVIDWPIERSDRPSFRVSTRSVSAEFYAAQVLAQRQMMVDEPVQSSPIILLAQDRSGRSVRVAMRKRTEPSPTT